MHYQVEVQFDWNYNRTNLEQDRDFRKHEAMFERSLAKGGRRDIFLGTRECQGYVAPCVFGEGEGAYDNVEQGVMAYNFIALFILMKIERLLKRKVFLMPI